MGELMCSRQGPASVLPQELGPRRAQLQDSANQTLALVEGRGGAGQVQLPGGHMTSQRPGAAVREKGELVTRRRPVGAPQGDADANEASLHRKPLR